MAPLVPVTPAAGPSAFSGHTIAIRPPQPMAFAEPVARPSCHIAGRNGNPICCYLPISRLV